MKYIISLVLFVFGTLAICQDNTNTNKFRQLNQDLPTPNSYRTASGAPGHEYWQQQVDYVMDITLNDDKQQIHGNEKITYTNNSPDVLTYLWLQLDQNVRSKESASHAIRNNNIDEKMSTRSLQRLEPTFEGGFNITKVVDANGSKINYHINKTMMRIDLPKDLNPKEQFSFEIDWWYNINNTSKVGGRSGYEHFEEDDNNVYCIAQFFPRLCVYNDVQGWQNKQFLGRGEFALEFGNYTVNITAPTDHLVASTGTLLNPDDVLTAKQKERLKEAETASIDPIIIATADEAEKRMKSKSSKSKTWKFHADNVRDFAFASSRRFIWDAIGVPMSDGTIVMAQSMWFKEGDCLWSKYSTKAVAHTIKWFSHYTFDYPYPTAWSIDGNMGMEYPMICFNYGRCEDDNTYSQRLKYGHIGVIIHEVGHNWFPMIVNSDERQWTWMDEGLNTYVQYLTEQQWSRTYPHRRGPARNIVNYMAGDKSRISPIMTNSESIYQFGNNAYGKPATALNILRETVVGREQFDFAFKTYANRWKFKHPEPGDLFRTLEDASGVDLDWFWRSWFYTTDHVDISITSVEHFNMSSKNPKVEKKAKKDARPPKDIGAIRNAESIDKTQEEIDPNIIDFYSNYDPLDVDAIDIKEYNDYLKTLSEEEKKMMSSKKNYYSISFENKGGIPMPIILQFKYKDGTDEIVRIPAEIWKLNEDKVSKVFPTTKEVQEIILDPYLETADTDTSNNHYPPKSSPSKFETFKQKSRSRGSDSRENPMQRNNRAKKIKQKETP